MGLHYNAFISYRHHPDDIKVASEIHRGLERFHIPRTLKKKVKPITRLFRDKEELPITSALNDDIGYALENADFLIVICSVHTKESIWVQREIESFLKTHPRNRVLTVLASGEPYDVIPDILLHDTVTDPETGEIRQIEVEPLSCDWREPSRRKRMQEELPRLAAALMGCAYDELRQRQRQYRMRRLITVFSISLAASLALAAYFLYTSITIRNANIQIQANYEQSQRNQSRHLATAAQERLEAGDRLTAISLALAALPSQDDPRPYVAEAEYVLSSALGVYSSSNQAVAIGSISPGTNMVIDQFWLTEDGSTLYLLDQRDIITAWDTQTFEKLGTIPLAYGYLEKVLLSPDGNILFYDDAFTGRLCSYSPQGQRLWELDDCSDFAFMADHSTLLILQVDADGNSKLLFLDSNTGDQVQTPLDLPHPQGLIPHSFYLNEYYPGFPIAISYSENYAYSFWLYDPVSGICAPLENANSNPDHAMMTEDGKLLLLTTSSENLVGTVEQTRLSAPITCVIDCYDLASRQTLWSSETTVYSFANGFCMEKIPSMDRILFVGGSLFHTLDIHTGQILSCCDAGSNVLAVQLGEQYASSVLEDGYLCNFWYEENYCYAPPCLEGTLSYAAINGGYYGLQSGDSQVTLYRVPEHHYNWEYDPDTYFNAADQYLQGSTLAFSDYDYIYLMELDDPDILWQVEKDYTKLLGFSSDGSKVMMVLENAYLVSIDRATQEVSHSILPSAQMESYTYVNSDYLLSRDQLFYTFTMDGTVYFAHYTPGDESFQMLPLFLEADLPADALFAECKVLAATESHAWVWANNGLLYEIDLAAHTFRTVAENLIRKPSLVVNADNSQVAFTTDQGIGLLTPGTEDTELILIDDATAGRLFYLEDILLALCDNGFLYRYDASGALLSRTKLSVGINFGRELLDDYYHESKISFQIANDLLIINAYGYCNVIDTNCWALRASMTGFIAYLEETQEFVCKADSGNLISFPLYSTDALIQLGLEQLGSFQLSGEQKAAYGIE